MDMLPNSLDPVVKEDPLVMYLVVRKSINMSVGKTAAQTAHASQMLQVKYGKLHANLVNRRRHDAVRPSQEEESVKQELIYEQWMTAGIRKVVLCADDKEWEKLKLEMNEWSVIVTDSGYTELDPGTDTVIGLWPHKKSQRSTTVKRLQVLK
jgi:PTH2 family peptidyl-tRNA hydrolase